MGQSLITCLMAKGVNTSTATVQRQKAIETGGIVSAKFRATMKFPDHMAVAARAKMYPYRLLLLGVSFKLITVFCNINFQSLLAGNRFSNVTHYAEKHLRLAKTTNGYL